jgi:hypothetical protein
MTESTAHDITIDLDAAEAVDEHPLMIALGQGLPITLLIDLIDPTGPRSFEMYGRELGGHRTIHLDTLATQIA